jgi:hypothetical protein
MGQNRHKYRLLMGMLKGNRSLGRTRRRWVDNIKMELGEIGWGGVDWIGLAQDMDKRRVLVNSVMNFWILYGVASQLVASQIVLSSTAS